MDPQAEIDQHLQAPADLASAPAPQVDPQAEIDQHLQAPQAPSVLDALQVLVARKYAVLLAYAAFGDQLRCVERDGLAKHFANHFEEERSWLYALHRMIAARGGVAYPAGVTVPQVPLLAPRPAVEALAAMEGELLELWADACVALEGDPSIGDGEKSALRAQLQEGARVDLAHAEDMRRYLGVGA